MRNRPQRRNCASIAGTILEEDSCFSGELVASPCSSRQGSLLGEETGIALLVEETGSALRAHFPRGNAELRSPDIFTKESIRGFFAAMTVPGGYQRRPRRNDVDQISSAKGGELFVALCRKYLVYNSN